MTLKEYSSKKEKARITTCLIYNTTSTDRLLIWFIGKAKRLYCFQREQLKSLELIRAFWRYNNKAWMNNKIIVEYLLWFDQEMKKQGKYILLLIDNFSAYKSGIE